MAEMLSQMLQDFGRLFRKFEVALLSVIFIAIVVLGLTQIGLRNLADSSLVWSDAAMRAGVLWIAMIASCIAAAESKHIRIDVLGKLLPSFWTRWIGRFLLFATGLICIAMVYASLPVVQLELEFQELSFLNVPRWLVLAIIPAGFTLMALRFMGAAVTFNPEHESNL
ncbi:MAG: TRAP transporter small permease [Pseudomonadota bacterium]